MGDPGRDPHSRPFKAPYALAVGHSLGATLAAVIEIPIENKLSFRLRRALARVDFMSGSSAIPPARLPAARSKFSIIHASETVPLDGVNGECIHGPYNPLTGDSLSHVDNAYYRREYRCPSRPGL